MNVDNPTHAVPVFHGAPIYLELDVVWVGIREAANVQRGELVDDGILHPRNRDPSQDISALICDEVKGAEHVLVPELRDLSGHNQTAYLVGRKLYDLEAGSSFLGGLEVASPVVGRGALVGASVADHSSALVVRIILLGSTGSLIIVGRAVDQDELVVVVTAIFLLDGVGGGLASISL
ncbi:hypothetical protein PGQ11_009078 [Apiospora arundinis]|uniref:Uncharacterized protein n=1 Tax=Apiospora arundinis TaxID=335852 RepID=A0ABR2IHU1_9PEZI